MKKRIPLLLVLGMLAVALGLLASCGGSNNSVTGNLLGANEEDGFTLMADPAEIVIDTTDPAAMVDPDSGLVFVEIGLTANALDETEVPQESLEVAFSTSSGSVASEGNPVLTDAEGNAMDTLTVFEDAPAQVEVSATDGTRIETITLDVTLILPNQPPVADAGMDISDECGSAEGTPVTLDGSGSTDPDSTEGTNDDIVSFEWFVYFGLPEQALLGEGMTLDVSLELGIHVITLQVTDSEGEMATDEVTVEIVDTTPPTISFVLDPDLLWPPNHDMHEVYADVMASDTCGDVTVALVSVTSSQPDNGLGDGDTVDDIQGVDAGTADFWFMLRAERQGPWPVEHPGMYPGRTYSVVYSVVDGSGNAAEASGTVLVPHDMGHRE
jgi:hypothetical protein